MSEQRVYSVRIGWQHDNVIMTPEEAFLVELKYSPECELHDLTELQGLKPKHFHKNERRVVDWFFGVSKFDKAEWTAEYLLHNAI